MARPNNTYRANRAPVPSAVRAARRQHRAAMHPYTARGKRYEANGEAECARRQAQHTDWETRMMYLAQDPSWPANAPKGIFPKNQQHEISQLMRGDDHGGYF